MYYTSYHDVLCGLHEQAEQTGFLAELESMAIRGLQERAMFENLLVRCQNEVEFLRQHAMERKQKHQVSKAGFSLIEIRIICFVLPF
jgi:hypothetical protein